MGGGLDRLRGVGGGRRRAGQQVAGGLAALVSIGVAVLITGHSWMKPLCFKASKRGFVVSDGQIWLAMEQ